ncbi:MAG: DEAD/DEAH box helicase, partial [Fidelibacterota bacterium]
MEEELNNKLNVREIIERLKKDKSHGKNITAVKLIPSKEGNYTSYPEDINPILKRALQREGIEKLYSHQLESYEHVKNGRDVVIVTPTASGKTLCYNLPVLQTILNDPSARALYLFPTKALSQDQMDELHKIVELMGKEIKTYTYDGDTPQAARIAIRNQGHIIITNPDMLHTGILPHHTKWIKLFENLRFVVIDEIHYYRGVLGSHLANVLRRLKRICNFYGSSPQFICSSATIANPGELAQNLIERDVILIDKNGAPVSEKFFILYNPPVVNKELGIRASYIKSAKNLATVFIKNDIQTIVFAISRLNVEIITKYLKEMFEKGVLQEELISGYRGGYLPSVRRRIEAGIRGGKIKGVVATNALELGIDIGQLDSCIISGYPGTISSTLQQAGRSGRRSGSSVAILVARSNPLDQFIVTHPEYFFQSSPEHGLINPDTLQIL